MILTSLLVAYTLSDFYSKEKLAAPSMPSTFYAESGEGELTVIRRDVFDESASVARGASRVPLAIFELSASCDAPVTVEEMTLHHTGRGALGDVSAIYAVTDYRRISRSRSFDGDGVVQLRLTGFTIDACGVRELVVYGSIASDASAAGEHSITLQNGSLIKSSAASINISGDESSNTTIVTTPLHEGTVTLRFLSTQPRRLYGHIETLARLQFTTDSRGAHMLRSIRLTNEGTARVYDFIDLRLEDSGGNILTRPAQHMDGRELQLFFEPTLLMDRSQTKVFLLRGEVRSSYSKTLNFVLEEKEDLVTTPHRYRL